MRGVFPPVSGSYDGSPADRFGDDIERLFFPEFSAMHNRVPPSALLIYNARKQIRQLQVRRPRTGAIERDQRTVVVSIDGACRDNGRPAARASWGVFLGPGSRYNDCGLLRRGVPQTSSRAEIEALAQALEIVWEFTRTDMRLTQVLIRSDSEYLCQGWSSLPGVSPIICCADTASFSHVNVDTGLDRLRWGEVERSACCAL